MGCCDPNREVPREPHPQRNKRSGSRIQRCWVETCATPSDVIAVYLRVADVETTYQMCRMCNIGLVTLPELISVLDTFRRNSLDFAPFCDILEVYSERNTNRETSMNTKSITNIQRQLDILSDGHQQVVDQAVETTAAIIALDARLDKSKESSLVVSVSMFTSRLQNQLDRLQEQLVAQSERASRVHDEIVQIRKALKIV